MNAPASTLPQSDNDGRTSRPVCFTSRSSAVAHMWRSARLASPSGTFRAVEFVDDAYQPVEGGATYQVVLGALDWEVRQVAPVDLARLVQSGMRSAVETCERRAKAHELAAGILRPGALHAQHLRYAAEERDRARELETRLVVSAVSK